MPDESVEVRPLEDWLIDHRWPDAYDLARAILASDWLAEHDARVRAEAEAHGMRILAGQFQQRGLSEAARIAFDTAQAVDAARVARDGGVR